MRDMQPTEIPMRTHAIPISRPHWKTASAVLLAGAVLFAATAAHADPRYGGGDRGGNHWKGGNRHWHAPHHRSHSYSSISLNFGNGGYYGRPYYAPSYYRPRVVYTQPYVYTQPQPVYYNSTPIQYQTQPSLTNDGRYCREYTKQVLVGGRMQESYGSACMQPDGAWEIES